MAPSFVPHPSSYRDPSGFLFYKEGVLYRQVNKAFRTNFDRFTGGGLYQHLVQNNLLISHQLIQENLTGSADWYATLLPETIPFISYPYEWSFDMLKDAALLTLEAARVAIGFDMMLKDASAYNIQLHNGKMIFIDTLSFEEFDERKPWVAYRQFCEQFFAPLALMHYVKKPLQNLFLAYPEGVPLDLASNILPFKSKLNLHTYLHIHLQATMSHKKVSTRKSTEQSFSKKKMLDLLRSLQEKVETFSFRQPQTVWSAYYEEAGQRGDYLSSKKKIMEEWLRRLNVSSVLDAGANEGEFSEIVSKRSSNVISADSDHGSVNRLYNKIKQQNLANICPLIIDFANPSPAIGVNNDERSAFLKRIKVDLVLALALIHHLAVAKNIPFDKIATMFASISRYLIIEFVPASDEKVSLLSENKKELLPLYSEQIFINTFGRYFSILDKQEIDNTGRTLYLMEKLKA